MITVPNGNGMSGRDGLGHIQFFTFKQFTSLIQRGGFRICLKEKFGIELPLVSYLAQTISSYTNRRAPLSQPLDLPAPELLATNFLIVAEK